MFQQQRQQNLNSDNINQLPFTQELMDPVDFAKINPLLEETTELIYPMRKYLIFVILFVIFSLEPIDSLLIKFIPDPLKHYKYVFFVLKAIIFVSVVFILDNIISKSKDKIIHNK